MTLRTIAIVGAGLAGTRAAETLRVEGFDGRVVLLGEERMPPYERPALSKEFLAGTRTEASLLLRPEPFWAERGIELALGERVVMIDPSRRRLHTDGGRELSFDGLVVATGARPRRLPLVAPVGVHELRTVADACALRDDLVAGSRLVVVGGGFVGAEVASTACDLGVRVTIVEAAAAPVARVLGARVGLVLAERWRSRGVDVRLGSGVTELRAAGNGRVGSVVLADGCELEADTVVVGVGVEPARELLPPRAVPGVVPAGDVVGPGHWTAAAGDGVAAARRLLGLPVQPPQPPYVWSDQFGLRLQVIGGPTAGGALELDVAADSFAVRYHSADGRLTGAALANRPHEATEVRKRLVEDLPALAA